MTSNDSLYAQYIHEREGLSSLWKSYGFVAYKIVKAECFIADMFVTKEHRRLGQGKALLNNLIEVAQGAGCEIVTANIHLWDPNANKTLAAALSVGFVVSQAAPGTLLVSKKIKEQSNG